MAITEIEIDTTALNRDVSTLSGTLRKIRSEVEDMYQAIRVLDRMWDGPANEMFVQQFQIDYENMQALCKAVEELISCMREAGISYTNGENVVGSIVAAIMI